VAVQLRFGLLDGGPLEQLGDLLAGLVDPEDDQFGQAEWRPLHGCQFPRSQEGKPCDGFPACRLPSSAPGTRPGGSRWTKDDGRSQGSGSLTASGRPGGDDLEEEAGDEERQADLRVARLAKPVRDSWKPDILLERLAIHLVPPSSTAFSGLTNRPHESTEAPTMSSRRPAMFTHSIGAGFPG
jgi:hypothetical protein